MWKLSNSRRNEVDWCLENEVPITPGVITPTEINMALNKGLHILKFFPAEAAGGQFDQISRLAVEAVGIVNEVRS